MGGKTHEPRKVVCCDVHYANMQNRAKLSIRRISKAIRDPEFIHELPLGTDDIVNIVCIAAYAVGSTACIYTVGEGICYVVFPCQRDRIEGQWICMKSSEPKRSRSHAKQKNIWIPCWFGNNMSKRNLQNTNDTHTSSSSSSKNNLGARAKNKMVPTKENQAFATSKANEKKPGQQETLQTVVAKKWDDSEYTTANYRIAQIRKMDICLPRQGSVFRVYLMKNARSPKAASYVKTIVSEFEMMSAQKDHLKLMPNEPIYQTETSGSEIHVVVSKDCRMVNAIKSFWTLPTARSVQGGLKEISTENDLGNIGDKKQPYIRLTAQNVHGDERIGESKEVKPCPETVHHTPVSCVNMPVCMHGIRRTKFSSCLSCGSNTTPSRQVSIDHMPKVDIIRTPLTSRTSMKRDRGLWCMEEIGEMEARLWAAESVKHTCSDKETSIHNVLLLLVTIPIMIELTLQGFDDCCCGRLGQAECLIFNILRYVISLWGAFLLFWTFTL